MSATLPTTRAQSWTYDPYSGHACEAQTSAGRDCRRVARCRYEWATESHYLCGTHGRGLEPESAS